MKLFDHTIMAHSDTEEVYDVYETTEPGSKQINLTDALGDTETYEKTIHSGHFMVSHVHDEAISEQEKGLDDELVLQEKESSEFAVEAGRASNIDSSLTKLFQYMSLVGKYLSTSGKLTSPKWKNFKGVKFRLKEKIRLNNIIWREWYMQYVKCLPPIVCHFSSPLADQAEENQSGIVDRTYWKRHLKTITNDYKKWRHYFNNKFIEKNSDSDILMSNSPYCEILQRTSENNSKRLTNLGGIVKKSFYQNPPGQLLMDEDYFTSFPDTLFLSDFLMEGSNLKEMSAFSDENFNEMIQDNCLDDMDTLDPLPSIFRCEPLSFNKANSTPSMQSPTMLTNGYLQEQNICGTNQSHLENLNLLSTNGGLMNLPRDAPTVMSPMEDKPVVYQLPSSEQLLSLLVSEEPLPDANVLDNITNSTFNEIPTQMNMAQPKNEFMVDNIFSVSSNASPNFSIEVQPSANLILSNQDSSDNVLSVFYTSNSHNNNNAIQCNHNSQSMPLLSGLLQQQKQQVIIQLPPGYQIITSQDIINQDDPSLPTIDNNFITINNAFNNNAIQVQSVRPTNQVASKSLGCLQAIQNMNDSCKYRQNFSTGSLAVKPLVNFRVPQHQQSKFRPKTSSVVNIQPRLLSSTSPSLQSSCIKRLLLPSFNSSAPSESSSTCSCNQFKSTNSLPQENVASQYSPTDGSNSSMLCEKRRKLRNEKPNSLAMTNIQNDKPSSLDHLNAIFQPINPTNTSSLPLTSAQLSYKTRKSVVVMEPEKQIDCLNRNNSPFQYAIDNPLISNVLGNTFNDDSNQLFKIPTRSRHASNDSASSHCEENFMMGPNKCFNKDLRRMSHITSEQKRRFSIKCGLDTLNELIPGLDASSGSRISKATTLHTAAEFIRKLKAERQELQEEIDRGKNEVQAYELAIKNVHSQMPVQGLPSTGSRTNVNQLKSWFQKLILQRSQDNWKYWIFGFIIEPLFASFETVVSTSNVELFRQSVLKWLTDHCSLVVLRPVVSNSLRKLSTSTCILVNPDGFQKQVIDSISNSIVANSAQL